MTQLDLQLFTPHDEDGVDPNRKYILKKIIKDTNLGTYSTWQIFKSHSGLWLGIRTFYYDTDYDCLEKVTHDEAVWLVKHSDLDVREFMDSLK